MGAHLRAIATLLILTLVICCVLYPVALWLFGAVVVPAAAEGSLVEEGTKVRGSALIAQPFNEPKYFQPRPSAASYNASASSGSNWAASQPLLRDRVARFLGPLVRYDSGTRAGQRVGPDVEAWFAADRGKEPLLARWAKERPVLSGRWVKDDPNHEAVGKWIKAHPGVLATWRKANPDGPEPDVAKVKDWPDSLCLAALVSFAEQHPGSWPVPRDGKLVPVRPDRSGKTEIADLQATLFDAWLTAHPDEAKQLRKVPADMVLASGSGLDPHITLRNALYQLEERVAEARAKERDRPLDEVKSEITEFLRRRSFSPLGGLVSEPLVNVLEVNRALDDPAEWTR